MLALEQEATLCGGQEFLARPAIVGVVRLAKSRQRDAGGVMEIVVVQPVQSAAAAIRWTQQLGLLGLVLGDDHDLAISGCRSSPLRQRGNDVFGRRIEDLLRRIQAEPVDVILANPVLDVGQHQLADRRGLRSIEVERLTPFVAVAVGEVLARKASQVVAIGPEVVVDHIEQDSKTMAVGLVHELPQIVRAAVQACRREPADAVVAPTELTGELRDWHQLNRTDAEPLQTFEMDRGGCPGAFRRERARVQLVKREPLHSQTRPAGVAPDIAGWIDELGQAVRPVGLISRGRVGIHPRVVVEPEPVTAAGPSVDDGAEVAVGVTLERRRFAVDDDSHVRAIGRPHPYAREPIANRLGADRVSAWRRLDHIGGVGQ